MPDNKKTKAQLIQEIDQLRKKKNALENSAATFMQTEVELQYHIAKA